eukprot:TRINITY_DN82692_c0_g1_i1.p1 TRINITY_DN82692_c0_g1~~TRINITY_DN82692_c0_g1_i1.p1  ORF type:complete len:207 (+),score=13.81 TRINITY_DN82692_c0_g1_i1:135-755(+)
MEKLEPEPPLASVFPSTPGAVTHPHRIPDLELALATKLTSLGASATQGQQDQEHQQEQQELAAATACTRSEPSSVASTIYEEEGFPDMGHAKQEVLSTSFACMCVVANAANLSYLVMLMLELWVKPLQLEYCVPTCLLYIVDFIMRRGSKTYFLCLEGWVIVMGMTGIVGYALQGDEYAYLYYFTLLKAPLDSLRFVAAIRERGEA